MNGDNPAARLLALLEAGREIPQGSAQARAAWQKILEMPQGDDSLLVERIGLVMRLPREAATIMHTLFPAHKEATSYWTVQVTQFFSTFNLGGNWDMPSRIDTHSISYLRSAADLIEHRVGAPPAKAALDELRADVEKLLKDVQASDLDQAVSKVVISHLHDILKALAEYRISGLKPIATSVDAAVGHAAVNKEYREKVGGSSVGERLWNTLKNASVLVTVADHMPGAIAAIEKGIEALQHLK